MLEHSFPREHLQLTNTVQVSRDHGGHKPTFIFHSVNMPPAGYHVHSLRYLSERKKLCMYVCNSDKVQQSKNLHVSQIGNYKWSVGLICECESAFGQLCNPEMELVTSCPGCPSPICIYMYSICVKVCNMYIYVYIF